MHKLLLVLAVVAACGDDHPGTVDDAGDGGVIPDGTVSSCDPPGHFGGAPVLTFVLPKSGTGFSYTDVQAAFPQVDWANLDRLYIPAGQYTNVKVHDVYIHDTAGERFYFGWTGVPPSNLLTGLIYRATADTTTEPPGTGWTFVPKPFDDVRVKPGSTYAGYGVQ